MNQTRIIFKLTVKIQKNAKQKKNEKKRKEENYY